MTHPLRSTGHYPASTHSLWVGKAGGELLRGSPPLSGASVLSASRLEPLVPCMGLFLSRSFGTPAHLLHQFLCSIRKPFPSIGFPHLCVFTQPKPRHSPIFTTIFACVPQMRGKIPLAAETDAGPEGSAVPRWN